MDNKELEYLSLKVSPLFEAEPAVVRIDHDPMILVGDLHGNHEALEFILKTSETLNCDRFVFLGDYVDRGNQSIEVLCRLFRLKIDLPESIVLLRGNHETAEINRIYGFYKELCMDEEMFALVNRTFDRMPIAAVVNGSVFCVHGGIGDPVRLDLIDKEDPYTFLWNDPREEHGLGISVQRCGTGEFGPDICAEVLRINDLDMMVRAHSALDTGYKWWFNGKLLSLFSIPDYRGYKSMGAFAFLKDRQLEIFVLDARLTTSIP